MKKVFVFSLFMLLFGFSVSAQVGTGQGINTPSFSKGMQVIEYHNGQNIAIITTPNIVSLDIYDSQGQIVWSGTGGYNRVDTSKWEEGIYYIVVIYPSGTREMKTIKVE